MSGWYVKRENKKYGPYTSTQLVEMAKKGQVLPIDWVARGENEKWMPASQVKGLFAATTKETAGPPPLQPLIAALQDANEGLRWQAVRALGSLRDPRAVEPLIAALQDSVLKVRETAAKSLEQIDASRAAMAIKLLLKNARKQPTHD